MIIESSAINMFSRSSFIERHEKKESLKAWTGDERPDFEGLKVAPKDANPFNNSKKDLLNISDKAKNLKPAAEPETDIALSEMDRMKILLIEKLMESLTGKKVKIKIMSFSRQQAVDNNNLKSPDKTSGTQPPAKKGWGMEYDFHESHYEHENMSFSAEGTIRTRDGKEIKFKADLVMEREFLSHKDISIREGDAVKIDPLVINFDVFTGRGSQLTAAKFSFDLNADGKKENISFAGQGSGFLSLDINYDGVINDGRELFGPQSGKGFAELSRYDSDNNGWIDENDFVFNRLRIWTKDNSNRDTLSSLKDKNIGAIYLGNIAGRFEIKNQENRSQGEVKSSGIFLKENGSSGTIQQIDLTA